MSRIQSPSKCLTKATILSILRAQETVAEHVQTG